MKHPLTLLSVSCLLLAGCDCHHDHAHGGACSHAHEEPKSEHAHAHGGACSHAHEEPKSEHAHAHGGACSHAHEERTPQHAHAHGANCSHAHEDHRHGEINRSQSHDAAKTVTVPLSVQRLLKLRTVRAEKRRLASTLTHPGRYELAPHARQTVATPVAGRLTLHVRPLEEVKKGAILFTVSSPDLIARARELAALEKRLAVYRQIKTPNAALENERAVKQGERAALLGGAEEKDGVITIRAPQDGRVEAYSAQNGAWVETGAAILQMIQPHALRFKALMAASEARRLKDGMKATVDARTGEVRLGVGDETGLVPVYVVFGEQIPALAGERADAQCVTDENESPVWAVPTDCIVRLGLQPTVFIRDPHNPERFIAVSVTPGLNGGGWTALEGLPSPDCEIVQTGVYELKLAVQTGETKSAGHFHADGTFHEGEH